MRQLSPSRRRLAKLQIDRVDTRVDDVSRIHRRNGHDSIDTTIPAGKLIFGIFAALAEFMEELRGISLCAQGRSKRCLEK
jgi:DNA invertase Pin-like site-specific DNA recombinase